MTAAELSGTPVDRARFELQRLAVPYRWVVADDEAYYRVADELGYVVAPSADEVRELVRKSAVKPIIAPYPPPEHLEPLFVVEVLPPVAGAVTFQELLAMGVSSEEEIRMKPEWRRAVQNRLKINIHQPHLKLSDLVGMEPVRGVVEKIKACQDDPLLRYKGVVLVGVPGVGKSYSAKCVAGELNRWLVEMSIGYIMDQPQPVVVIRRIFSYLERIDMPCVLWIDEVEKAVADDSSRSRRLVGELLKILNDLNTETGYRLNGFFWMTANRIEWIQERYPELLRKGRVDVVFFANTPFREDAQKLFEYYAKVYGVIGNDVPEKFGKRMVHIAEVAWSTKVEEKGVRDIEAQRFFYTPAEIEQVMKEVAREVKVLGSFDVNSPEFDEVVLRCCRSVYPIVISMSEEISRMRGQKEQWEEV